MPIQILLTLGLLGALVYASVQQVAPRPVTLAFAAVVILGVYFVWMPDHTTVIAQWLGVARGTDLLIYIWILISIFVGVNLHLKIRSARAEITELARAMALASAQAPPASRPSQHPSQMGESSE